MLQNKSVIKNIKECYSQIFSAEQNVADYILKYPEKAVMMNVSELANASGVSDATVIRMCKHIGYQGYYQMKIILSHDLGRNGVEKRKESTKKPDTIKELFELFTRNLMEVAHHLHIDVLLACVELIKKSDQVHVIGVGNTAPVAADLAFRLGRMGIRTTHSMVPEYFLNYINLAKKNDMVIAISKSGSSKQILQALELAKQKKLKIIVITAFEYSPISKMSDYLLLTKCGNGLFDDRGPDSHLNEMAINDILLYFVLYGEVISKKVKDSGTGKIDEVELMLSEYKL